MIYFLIISHLFNSIVSGITSNEQGRLPGVSIYDSKNNFITKSDENGFFSFTTNDIHGTPLIFKKEGYTSLYLYEGDLRTNLKLVFEIEIIGKSDPILITAANELKEHSKYGPIEIKKIIPASQIRANIKDQLEANTNLLIQESSGNGAAPIYKGFRANKLLYTINGIRFNNAFFKSGNTPYIGLFNPIYFKNISVADGGVSLVYGSDAIGGAIDFSQPDPHIDEYLTVLPAVQFLEHNEFQLFYFFVGNE